DPIGMLFRRALLKKRLGIGAVDVSLQNDRTVVNAAQRAVGDGEVVIREIELRVAALRKKNLVGIGDLDVAARCLERQRILHQKRLRMPRISLLKSAPARAAVSMTS